MRSIFVIILLFFLCIKNYAAPKDSISTNNNDTIINAWRINQDNLERVKITIDTIVDKFHIINPLFKRDISYSYLGNLGTASISNNYFTRRQDHNFIFIEPYRLYMHFPWECTYYNTKMPFTNISFTSGGNKKKREEYFRVIHNQNIMPELNYGIDFEHILSKGQYMRQRAKIYGFTFFINFMKKQYSLHTNFNLNSIEAQENGGITDDEFQYETENYPIRLNEAKSLLKNNSFFVLQQYRIGTKIKVEKKENESDTSSTSYIFTPKLKISHLFNFETSKRGYKDEDLDAANYPNIFCDSISTMDSVYNKTLTNSLQVEILEGFNSKFRVGGKVLISNEIDQYGYNTPGVYSVTSTPEDTVTNASGTYIFYRNDTTYYHPDDKYLTNNDWNKSYYSNNLVSVSLFNRYGKKGKWNITGKYYISGYKKEDYELRGDFIRKFGLKSGDEKENDPIIFNASFVNNKISPNFFYTQYYSNHYKWYNSFDDENKLLVKASISKPKNKFKLGVNYLMNQNYIFMDSTALPKQEANVFYVLSAYLDKTFKFGKFYFANRFVYQQSENDEVLPLPELLYYNSTYFQHLLNIKSTGGKIKIKTGFDFYYHSKYYANRHSPALGMFYQQDLLIESSKKIGEYPYFDVFLSLKIKKLRILLKYDHIKIGGISKRDFTSPHYPMNRKVFKLGLSWSFYD